MDRVSAANKQVDKFGSGKHGYTDGDPLTGVQATIFAAAAADAYQEEIVRVIEGAGLTPASGNLSQLLAAINALIVSGRAPVAVIADRKATNTAGGTFTAGAWRTRDLNTEIFDPSAIVAISANRFTLQAGTYEVDVIAPATNVDAHMARLYNVTDAAVVEHGTAAQTVGGGAEIASSESHIRARFTIAAAKDFEVQHYAASTYATYGFGIQCNFSGAPETYTVATIRKVA